MKLIVGLGNPGKEYLITRHNVGFNVVDMLANDYGVCFSQNKKFNSLEATLNVNGEKVILIKPLTYMNLSGDAVIKYVNYYGIDVSDILIIHDDLDMEFGKIRFVFNSSSGGHNGIKDIINRLNSQEFARLKIGISNDKNIDTKDYVLGKFSNDELDMLNVIYKKLGNIVFDFVTYDFVDLKQKYNSKNI